MKKLFNPLIVLSICIIMGACQPKTRIWNVSSPDGNLTLNLIYEQLENGKSSLAYTVALKKEIGVVTIIDTSYLGITRENDGFTDNLISEYASNIKQIDENYRMSAGKQLNIHNQANELSVTFTNDQRKKLIVDLRAYNDGAAFRYRFPEERDSIREYTVTGETTSFHIAGQGKAWMAPYDKVSQYTPAYETYYENGIPIGTQAPGKEGWGFPALFKTENAWILLTESNLKDNFYGAHLQPGAQNGIYRIRLPEKEEARSIWKSEPTSILPWVMPWRVIITGENLATIVESNLVNNVADPSTVEDWSWIKPGRASWSWWSDHDSPQHYDELIPFVDLADSMGWEYSLVDANWNIMRNGNLEDVVNYAKDKGVGILAWYNSGGPHNTVSEMPRDAMFLREKRRQEFEKLHNMGVKGVKVDFFQSDKPFIIRLYHDILRDAADYHILCNFHGCTIPRGWRRTFPHMLTLESVRGAESYSFSKEYPEKAPWHNTILPFTRNAIGPMDYTPVTFTDQTYPHITTNGHELALTVVFESGIFHFADRVSAYLNAPDFVQDYLKEVPVAWDETRLVDGYPGQYCIIARRKGNLWYIGAINGLNEDKNVEVKLPFVTEGNYLLEIISDGKDDRSFQFSKKQFEPGDSVSVSLRPHGGFTGVLRHVE